MAEHNARDIISTTNTGTFIVRVRYSAIEDLPKSWHQEESTVVGGCVCDAFCAQSHGGRCIRLLLLVRIGTNRAPGRDKATASVVLLDKAGSPASTGIGTYRPACKVWTGGGYSFFAKKDDVEENCVVDGYFAALCSVAIIGHWPPPPASLFTELPELGQDLAEMLDQKVLTDVSFNVDGETFCAHRFVLAARSPVFRAELYGPMAESKMVSITIKDMKASTFRYMLDYMYRGTLTSFDNENEADDVSAIVEYQHLLIAADIYALETLKKICESTLCEDGIAVDTVCSMLELAEEHTCPELKARCLDFLAADKNFKIVATSHEYLHLMQSFPSLLVQVRDRLEQP